MECQHVFQSAFLIGIPSGCEWSLWLQFTLTTSDDAEGLSLYLIAIQVLCQLLSPIIPIFIVDLQKLFAYYRSPL